MVRCPECQSPLSSVYRTMQVTEYRIRRYRRCFHCKHSFKTTEQVSEPKKKKVPAKQFDEDDDFIVED